MINITQYTVKAGSFGVNCIGFWEMDKTDDEGFIISGIFCGTFRGDGSIDGEYKKHSGQEVLENKGTFAATRIPKSHELNVTYKDSKTNTEKTEIACIKNTRNDA